MGHYGVVVRDGEERRLRVHNNIPHEVFVLLSHEDVVDRFLLPTPLKACEIPFLGVLKKKSVQQSDIMVGS